jgi:hypothetical protein
MYSSTKISRSNGMILVFKAGYSWILTFKERNHYLMKCLEARKIRADLRRKANVGARGGQPSNNAKKGRSLGDDQPCGCRVCHGGILL